MTARNLGRRRRGVIGIGAIAIGLAALAWPAGEPAVASAPQDARQFAWGRDSIWQELESSFALSLVGGCTQLSAVQASADSIRMVLTKVQSQRIPPTSALLDSLENHFFALAPRVAVCGTLVNEYVALQGRLREAIKSQSANWDLSSREARDRLYRALYGTRAAVEEVMLQQRDGISGLYAGSPVSSSTPSAVSNGVELRSGDILVSRGGYPTSALIARGNDYPGNFSHIAFVHVDSATHAISVIEAHIERGVVVATADQYLADKKLRVMLLRLRPDLPALQRDPMLPHRAASSMLARARTEHIPYDFTMDYEDASRLFCSEVASAAYREHGVTLWTGISTISAPGLRRWLASFGVRQFETQEPSDLEYDPQLAVVAEWRDPDALFEDHLDNAVTDAMLQGAERGEVLEFNWYALPLARLLKAYSWARQQLGGAGKIPEGMSPAAALRNRSHNARHVAIKGALRQDVDRFIAEKGYRPPYWALVTLASEAAIARR